MPTNVVKTPEDEAHWEKAKARAAEEGRPEDWPYIMGIYKRMKGGKLAKSFVISLEKSLKGGERWITIHPHGGAHNDGESDGRHVLIDGSGKIIGGLPKHIMDKLNEKHGHGKPKQPHEMTFNEYKGANPGMHPETARVRWMSEIKQAWHAGGKDAIRHALEHEKWLEPYIDNGWKTPRAPKEKIAGEGFPFSKEQNAKNNKFIEHADGTLYHGHGWGSGSGLNLQQKDLRQILHKEGYKAALEYLDKRAGGTYDSLKMSGGPGKGMTSREYLHKLAEEHKAKGEGLAPGEKVEKSLTDLKRGNPALVIPRKVAPVETSTSAPEELRQGVGDTLKLYHVTPTRNVSSIKQSGLIPRYGKPTQGENPAYNATYFHTSKDRAKDFHVGEPKTTLCVHLPVNSDTARRLVPDEDTFHRTAAEAISKGDGVAYKGYVPPEWIE